MVRIRLRRVGAKKQASYRVVVADQRSPRDGRFIELLGWYNPRTDPPSFKIDEGRALHWLSVGAQPTEAVSRLLKKMGTFEKHEQVMAGVDIEDVMAEAAKVAEAEAAEEEVPAPLEEKEEIAAEASVEEVEGTDETDEIIETTASDEGQETLEETGGEEEGDDTEPSADLE